MWKFLTYCSKLANKDDDCEVEINIPQYNTFMDDMRDAHFKWKKVAGRGSFVKRISAALSKLYGWSLTEQEKSGLGSVLDQCLPPSFVHRVEVSSNIDWAEGAFGDEGSCFFDDHKILDAMDSSDNCFAMKMYNEDKRGVARAWLVKVKTPTKHGLVLTNPYGGVYNTQVSAILHSIIGGNITTCHIAESDFYINGGGNSSFKYLIHDSGAFGKELSGGFYYTNKEQVPSVVICY
jgi:hypothetical protein